MGLLWVTVPRSSPPHPTGDQGKLGSVRAIPPLGISCPQGMGRPQGDRMHHPDIAHGNTGECLQTVCDLPLQTLLIQEGSGSRYDLGKLRLLLYPMQLVPWSSSCSHWWFAGWVCSFPTACQHTPSKGSLWDQGLAAVESYESQLFRLFPVVAIMSLASVPGLCRRWWFSLRAYAGAYLCPATGMKKFLCVTTVFLHRKGRQSHYVWYILLCYK